MTSRFLMRAAAALLAAAAWAGEAAPVRPPERLSETGLYAATGTATIAAGNLPYSPQYPLWTDGAAKSRWIRLPEGSKIDVRNVDAWRFPVGTKLWKEFAFAGRKVETRMLWRATADAWVYATYVWNEAQTDAELAPEAGLREHAEIAPGKRHSIPAIADCRTCHESGPSTVLGFSALQLSDDRDPLALHAEPLRPGMVTLSSLVERGRLEPPRPDLASSPPRIAASSPRERAVLGYLAGNCAHCHNPSGPLARLGLSLAHDSSTAKGGPEPSLATAVDAKGRYEVPGAPDGASRTIARGEPGCSAIVYRMASRRPSSQMPPLGTVIADREAVELVKRWIAEDLAPASVAAK